uniref:Uncharacterized protein n=1 Tax=Manihot esculenta TaxID=3983 RepID=A0A2C9WI45_MANES
MLSRLLLYPMTGVDKRRRALSESFVGLNFSLWGMIGKILDLDWMYVDCVN